MAKDVMFTMKLDASLRDEFMAEAKAADRPASQIVRELMRGYIHGQRQAREYEAFLHGKVATAREDWAAGRACDHETAEAEFELLRQEALKRAGV
ncbi:MAG TPA: antitoxin of toxin-antitoxin stability system [Pedomonas sp.]|nr:antitoxin of toxin-antitoxin stability system [Pedomonas sp.]